ARRILRDAKLQARSGLSSSSSLNGGEPRSRSPEPAIPPGLKLHARRIQDAKWALGLALPNLSALAGRLGVDLAEVDRARFKFSNRPESWMPGRALRSYSDSIHWLTRMPSSLGNSIIEFQNTNDGLRRLTEQFKILSRPPWLLRIHADGIARQV